ncbi:MAG: YceD family protein [Bacteroidia bacterium]
MKKSKKQYVIPFSGLSLGEHEFDFEVNDAFFESRPYSEIQKGNFKVHVLLTKYSSMLSLHIENEGEAEVLCDKCSEPFMLPISSGNNLMVKIGVEESTNDNEDVLFIGAGEHELDIEQQLYEYIASALPYSRTHPEGSCNEEVLKEIEKIRVDDFNEPEEEKNDDDENDDPWELLKQQFKN